MKIVLPKISRGYFFERLFPIEMNDFDVERLLSSLFFLVVTRGRQRGGLTRDARSVDRYLAKLASHPRMHGFDNEGGARLLSRWVRSSVVRVGRAGRGGVGGEQLEFVLPLTLLTYKTGLPAESSRQRNVHLFLYRILKDALNWAGVEPNAEAALNGIFLRAFGQGVVVEGAPKFEGHYDAATPLDLHTLLCLNLLDGFDPRDAGRKIDFTSHGDALVEVSRGIGRDLLLFITAYRDRLPALALTRGLMALIGFELFVYTVKLLYATNDLVRTGEIPAAMQDGGGHSPPGLYVDFTRERGAPSDEMARSCVERDLEELRTFFESALTLRTVHRFVELKPQLRERLSALPTPRYLQALARLSAGDADIDARAEQEIEAIQHETLAAAKSESDRETVQAALQDAEQRYPASAVRRAVHLITAAQERGVQAYVAWFWSIGGLRKSFGILDGSLRGRRNWRYAMSDDLLAALVQLALIRDEGGRFEEPTIAPRMRLTDFLGFLDGRFGVIVDRPPDLLDSAMYRIAAKTNLDALRRRLRQMGMFEELSDDFTAQYLRSPQFQEGFP